MVMRSILACLAVSVLLWPGAGGAAQPETPEQRDQRMAWWRDARFGMFIHWGLYSIPAGEWEGKPVGGIGEWIMNHGRIPVADYEKLAGQFNPVKFDAKQWVRIARDAGMKYIVITSKHHDGFCLWDSKVSGYDMTATPFKRDLLKELADACREEGLVLCFYHSIMDWHHPDAQAPHYPEYNTGKKRNPNFPRYFENYLKPQLKELLTSYGRIGVMWFDGEWIPEYTEEMGWELYNFCKSLQPDLIINNRVGKSRRGMSGMSASDKSAGDFGTPEQEIPATGFPGLDWESCMTMNDTWGFKKNDHNWKSAAAMIRMVIDTSSKGGNLLLNVGPTAEGEIPRPSVDRLAEVGRWMKVNSEAIYATGPSPFKKLAWGKATRKGGTLYLHVFDWPKDGTLLVPMSNAVTRAYLLADRGSTLQARNTDAGLAIAVPAAAPDPVASVVVVEVVGEIQPLLALIRQDDQGRLVLRAADADLVGHAIQVEHKDNQPNIGFWTNASDHVQWTVQVDRPGTFDVELVYACDPPSAGSTYTIAASGAPSLAGKVAATGGWADFQTARPGILRIERPGPATITIKPDRKAGEGVMNLRSITLVPAR
jgi:alpha-L-fucosidase